MGFIAVVAFAAVFAGLPLWLLRRRARRSGDRRRGEAAPSPR